MKSTLMKRHVDVNELEQYSRRNCLRVFGVEETKEENPEEIIMNLAKGQLGITTITPDDIERTHRVGRPTEGRPRAIIVQFMGYKMRNKFIQNRRKLKGTKIVVKEDLTYRNQQLLKTTQEHRGTDNAWSKDGKIFAHFVKDGEKIIRRIKDLEDLEKYSK